MMNQCRWLLSGHFWWCAVFSVLFHQRLIGRKQLRRSCRTWRNFLRRGDFFFRFPMGGPKYKVRGSAPMWLDASDSSSLRLPCRHPTSFELASLSSSSLPSFEDTSTYSIFFFPFAFSDFSTNILWRGPALEIMNGCSFFFWRPSQWLYKFVISRPVRWSGSQNTIR